MADQMQYDRSLYFCPVIMVALWNGADHYIYGRRLDVYHTSADHYIFILKRCGLSANLECRSEMRCTWLAAYT